MIRLESSHVIASPREAVWPILANTDRLNRSLGLPPVKYDLEPRAEGGSAVTASARFFGLPMRWRELPFQWLEPEFYFVRRVFESSPFIEARMGIELQEQPGGRTRVMVYAEMLPRNPLGKWLAHRLLGPKTKRDMRRIIAHAEEFLRGQTKVALPQLPRQSVNEPALQSGLKKLREAGQPAERARRLEEFLRESPDVELNHIRPLAIARQWKADPWDTLRLFLHATRSGLLDLSWEILCPNCRSSRDAPVTSLNQLKRDGHCDVCQIQFDAEFDKSVELKFAVHSAIRRRDEQTFCLAGPGGGPHIVSQLWLEPHEERDWKLPELTRALRLRSPQIEKPLILEPENVTGGQRLLISCDATGFNIQHEPGESRTARFINANSFPVQLSLEGIEWSEDILTAARVTNWQEFRDLFSTEVISPTEHVTVGAQVVLFTDLRGSTALYHGLGDGPAYALVRDHFSILTEAVRTHHGTLVKTIGDAVMATFSRVDEALGAVRQMHRLLQAAAGNKGAPLQLKSSLHIGPCLAVNANGRLDFFGTTINRAARMVECCEGGDLTVSDELFHRPEMASFLTDHAESPQPREVQFRGFDTAHRVWRIGMV